MRMFCADRTVAGEYENYITPEHCVPDKPIFVPWESNITLGTLFSFVYGDDYKSVKEVIYLLVDVVAKGGNLAINIGHNLMEEYLDKLCQHYKAWENG